MNPPIRTPWPRPRSAARVQAPTHALAKAEAVVLELLDALESPPPAAAEDDASEFSRCGWFDSSLELAAGLDVIEHVDSLPEGLPWQAAH